jgi:hypothetical protein
MGKNKNAAYGTGVKGNPKMGVLFLYDTRRVRKQISLSPQALGQLRQENRKWDRRGKIWVSRFMIAVAHSQVIINKNKICPCNKSWRPIAL